MTYAGKMSEKTNILNSMPAGAERDAEIAKWRVAFSASCKAYRAKQAEIARRAACTVYIDRSDYAPMMSALGDAQGTGAAEQERCRRILNF